MSWVLQYSREASRVRELFSRNRIGFRPHALRLPRERAVIYALMLFTSVSGLDRFVKFQSEVAVFEASPTGAPDFRSMPPPPLAEKVFRSADWPILSATTICSADSSSSEGDVPPGDPYSTATSLSDDFPLMPGVGGGGSLDSQLRRLSDFTISKRFWKVNGFDADYLGQINLYGTNLDVIKERTAEIPYSNKGLLIMLSFHRVFAMPSAFFEIFAVQRHADSWSGELLFVHYGTPSESAQRTGLVVVPAESKIIIMKKFRSYFFDLSSWGLHNPQIDHAHAIPDGLHEKSNDKNVPDVPECPPRASDGREGGLWQFRLRKRHIRGGEPEPAEKADSDARSIENAKFEKLFRRRRQR